MIALKTGIHVLRYSSYKPRQGMTTYPFPLVLLKNNLIRSVLNVFIAFIKLKHVSLSSTGSQSIKLTEGENKGPEFTVLSATVELSQGKATSAVRN